MNQALIIVAQQKQIELLTAKNAELHAAKDAAVKALMDLEKKYQDLQLNYEIKNGEYDNLKKAVFGTKSERFSALSSDQSDVYGKQISLFDSETVEQLKEDYERDMAKKAKQMAELQSNTVSSTPITAARKKATNKPTGRKPFAPNLERITTTVEPEGVDLSNAVLIGYNKTEILQMTPAKIWVEEIRRPKYLQKNEQTKQKKFFQAPANQQPIDRIAAGSTVLASMIVDKFQYHLPINRQIKKYDSLGYKIAASTINGWMDKVQELLDPLMDVLVEDVLNTDYLKADESTIGVLGIKKGKLHKGYMWVYYNVRDKLLFYDFAMGRGKEYPIKVLKDFKGRLQVDGYGVYETAEIGGKECITLLFCHAHARRYFVNALLNDHARANYYLTEIKKVYEVEAKIKELNLTGDDVVAYRKRHAEPILKSLGEWLQQQKDQVVPQTMIGKAVNYALSRWDGLMEYLQLDDLQIDNNSIEAEIRPLAMGRHAYLFAGSKHGAQRNAIMYSLIACCKMHGVDPYTYFVDVINRISSHKNNLIKELLPHNWKPLETATSIEALKKAI